MIDRQARDQAAELLRHFAAGRLTNVDLERHWPASKDEAIAALESTVWCFYDDLRAHAMQGPFRLSPEGRRAFARWVLFLHTDEAYRWPPIAFPGIRPLRRSGISRMLGWVPCGARKEARFMAAGALEVWPFIDVASFEQARRQPRLLAGA